MNIKPIPKRINFGTLMNLFTLNCKLIKNKTHAIEDFISSHGIDILAITETWLGTLIDKSVISEMLPDGHDIQHVSRDTIKGGGVAVVFKHSL